MAPLHHLLPLLLTILPSTLASCALKCSNHGTCNTFSQCVCHTGFAGAACEERLCPFDLAFADSATADDSAHATAECSNRGHCDRATGLCTCMEGFTGKACHRTECPSQCNSRGRCVNLNEKAATTRNSDSVRYTYEGVWDAEKIYGCLCDDGYEGYDCSLLTCPDGDDPLTTEQVDEVQLLKCTANPTGGGSFALYFDGKVSSTISAKATAASLEQALETIDGIGDVTVTYSDGITYACTTATANVISVTFTTSFGSLPALVPYTDDLTPDGSSITVAADGVTSMTSSLGTRYYSVKGTKENTACANRGTCETSTGTCQCYTDNGDTFASSNSLGGAGVRGDCGYAAATISNCPGETSCSGHGTCAGSPTYLCSCSDGWTGGNCNERLCPTGGSWFAYPQADESAHKTLAECSDAGLCDKSSGTCECKSGYFGEACQYMACGGGTAFPCSGHGTCLSMRHLSWESDNDGDATDFIYGTDPNNFETWDADRVFGCQCDADWEGYDCSLRRCPYGDNPGTYGDLREVQLLQCEATSGTFQLQFRQEYTEAMPFNVEIAVLEAELEKLTTINNVEVEYSIDKITYTTNTTYLPNTRCGTNVAGTSIATGRTCTASGGLAGTGASLDECSVTCSGFTAFQYTIATLNCACCDAGWDNGDSTYGTGNDVTVDLYNIVNTEYVTGAVCLLSDLGTASSLATTGGTLEDCKVSCDADAGCKSIAFTTSTSTCDMYNLDTNSTSKSTITTGAQSYYHTDDPLLIKGVNRKGFCTNSTQENILQVTFNNPSGNVPAIVVYSNSLLLTDDANAAATGIIAISTDGATLGTNVVFTSNAGTTDREYCSGRGTCNHELGSCTCHTGWGSSDGFGGMGSLNDCGFRQDVISVEE